MAPKRAGSLASRTPFPFQSSEMAPAIDGTRPDPDTAKVYEGVPVSLLAIVTVALATGIAVGEKRSVNVVDWPAESADDPNPPTDENGPAVIPRFVRFNV